MAISHMKRIHFEARRCAASANIPSHAILIIVEPKRTPMKSEVLNFGPNKSISWEVKSSCDVYNNINEAQRCVLSRVFTLLRNTTDKCA
jgi:hypothetical protein